MKTKDLTRAVIIAAMYVVLTYIANLFGLSNGVIQVRFSEALTVLPLFTASAVPGLFVGCIISNLLTGAVVLDVIFGSLATLAGAIGTYFIGRFIKSRAALYLSPLPPIIANTLVVPLVLRYVYQAEGTVPFFMLTVGAGEVISCGLLGIVVAVTVEKNKNRLGL
ncbi:MAG: QueT transporter family protein [Firmicutes bacterium]|nr:QueT transporter family protein [Bacillota bacterium]